MLFRLIARNISHLLIARCTLFPYPFAPTPVFGALTFASAHSSGHRIVLVFGALHRLIAQCHLFRGDSLLMVPLFPFRFTNVAQFTSYFVTVCTPSSWQESPISKIVKMGDDEPDFVFAKLAGVDKYRIWAREMRYSLEPAGLWEHTQSATKNPKPAPIGLKAEDLANNAKLERQERCVDKINAWNQNNLNFQGYLGHMCLGQIQQESQAVRADWAAHDLWEWLRKRYTLQNTASKWATIFSCHMQVART